MDQKERQVIDDLFGKLRQVEGQAAQRDPQAEEHIRQQVARLPAAPYYMAQAILVQEQALATLQSRVQHLEQQAARPQQASGGGGGFLSSIFGGGQSAPQHRQPSHQQGYGQAGGYGQPGIPQNIPPQYMQQGGYGGGMMGGGSPWGGGRGGMGGGGGFLAGAMQTAVGVAGGMMVASALTSAFDSATVSESEMAGMADQAATDAGLGDAAGADAAGAVEPAGFQDAGYEDPGAADFGGGDFGGGDEI